MLQRRRLIKAVAATSCLGGLYPGICASAAREAAVVSSVTPEISLITGLGGNITVHKGSEGLTLIDSGGVSHTGKLLETLNEIADDTSVNYLFNTHWHDDHSGGNEAIRALGANIIAHENTKLWMTADFDVHWRDTTHKPRADEALPDITFYRDGVMDLGEETVHYYHGYQGHTDGDIYLLFPDSNVMVAGGLLSNYRYPVPDIATGGWIGALIDVNAAMLELADNETVIIPDSGPALRKSDLQAQHDMLADLYETMKELARLGYNGYEMLAEADLTSSYDAVWGDPTEFVLESYRGMWAHTYDMGGFI